MPSNGETAEDDVPAGLVATLEAGLEYVTDGQPGIRRKARRGRFEYRSNSGEPVRDAEAL
jgi:DNA topoisomerase IB